MPYWQYEYFPSEFKSNYWGLRGTDHKTYYPGEEVIVWGSWALGSYYDTPTGYLPFFTLSHPDANTANKQATLQSLFTQPTDARYNNAFNYQSGQNISMNGIKVGKIADKATFDAANQTLNLDLSKPFVLGLSGYDSTAAKAGGSSLSFAQGMTSTVEIFIYATGPTNMVDCTMQFRQITATANPDSDLTIASNNYTDLANRKGSFARGTSPGSTSGGYISLSSNMIYNCHGSVFDANGESIFYFTEGVTTQNIEIRNGTFINAKGLASVYGNLRDTSRITFRKCTFVDSILGQDMVGATRMRFTDTHFGKVEGVREADLLERPLDNGTAREPTPLVCVVATSNELPEPGEGMEALYDRFLVRLSVPPVGTPESFLAVAGGAAAAPHLPEEIKLTLDDLAAIRAAAEGVTLPEGVQRALVAPNTDGDRVAMALLGLERVSSELAQLDSLLPVVQRVLQRRPTDPTARSIQLR